VDEKSCTSINFLDRHCGAYHMASSKKDDHYAVVKSGRMDATGPFVDVQREINIERFLSKVNRRLYRQSRCYSVKLDLDPTSAEIINVYALSDSWMNERALKMAYNMYLENSEDERDRLKGSSLARWSDFRVLSGSDYPQLNPVQFNMPSLSPVQLAAGEFENTLVVDAAGVAKNFSWAGATGSRYSILDEYDKAGNAQTDPGTSTGDMPYDDLMADDDAVMAESLQLRGANPPYDAVGVNADRTWVRIATLAVSAAQKLSTGFFKAPCGIVLITQGAGGDEAVNASGVTWSVKSGDYKGVHAPSLLE
jgi:hypothetical protein